MTRSNSGRRGRDLADELERADAIAERVTEKASRKAAKLSAKADQLADKMTAKAAKVAEHAERLDRFAAHFEALDLWTRAEPGRRQPRFSRAEIASIALRIADTDGLDAVSMRRVAEELGAGTMTLYHYVRTKDELLALVKDEVMGELVVADPLPTEWRDAVTLIARRTRDVLRRHPWVFDLTEDPPIGPNSVRHFDQSLQAVASLPLALAAKLDIITAVDEYVFGHCMHVRDHEGYHENDPSVFDYINELVAGGGYPQLAALIEADGPDGAWKKVQAHAADPSRFDRSLSSLLDGLEQAFMP